MRRSTAILLRCLAAWAPVAVAQACAVMTWSVLSPTPAAAQVRDDRYPFLERRQRWWPGSRFDPFGMFPRSPGPYYEPRSRSREPRERSQAADSSRAPPPRKSEVKPATTVLVLGDSMADWLAYGLEEAFADSPDIGVVRKIKTVTGLIRADQRAEDWLQTARESLASERPDYVVVMIGLSDRQPIRERALPRGAGRPTDQAAAPPAGQPATTAPDTASPPGRAASTQDDERPPEPAGAEEANRNEPAQAPPGPEGKATNVTHEFRSEPWIELYVKRIDGALAVLRSKGVPVLWVGIPAIRGTRSRSEVSFLNDLFRSRVEKAGSTYVDVWEGFIDEDGSFMTHGPDYDGQTRRLRTADGVHFTKAGAIKLARYVEREIKRLMLARATPMAMPTPEQQSPEQPGGPAARAIVGPVVPLNGIGAAADELAGSGPAPSALVDPLASRVLVRGEPAPPQSGRADDFSWPRTDMPDANAVTPFDPPAPPGAAAPAQVKRTSTPATAKGTPQKRTPAEKSPPPKQVRQSR